MNELYIIDKSNGDKYLNDTLSMKGLNAYCLRHLHPYYMPLI